VPQERKRRTIALKGTFQQFKQMQEEQKHEQSEAEAAAAEQMVPAQNAMIVNNQVDNVNPAGPNIIGNVEDYPNMQLAEEEEAPVPSGGDVQMEEKFEEEGSKYKDITGQLKRSKRNRGKSPF